MIFGVLSDGCRKFQIDILRIVCYNDGRRKPHGEL